MKYELVIQMRKFSYMMTLIFDASSFVQRYRYIAQLFANDFAFIFGAFFPFILSLFFFHKQVFAYMCVSVSTFYLPTYFESYQSYIHAMWLKLPVTLMQVYVCCAKVNATCYCMFEFVYVSNRRKVGGFWK